MIPPDDFQLDLELEPEPVTKAPHADKTPNVNNQNIESVQDKSEIKADKTQYAQELETQIIQDSTPEKNFFEVEKSAFIPEVKSDPLVHNEEKVDQVHKENAAPDSDIQSVSDTDEKYVSASKRLSVSIIGYKAVSVTDDKTVSVTDERSVSKSEDKYVSVTDDISVPLSDDKAAIVTVDKSAPVSDDKAVSVTVDKSVSKSEDKAVTENESALGQDSKPALNIKEFNSVPIPDTQSETTLKGKPESTKQEEKLILDEQDKIIGDKAVSAKETKSLTAIETKTEIIPKDTQSTSVEINKENESLQDDKTASVHEDQPKSELPDKIKEVETPKSPKELILEEIIDLAKNSCDENIKEAIPEKVENLRKILDEKPVAPAAPPPSVPPPPPPAPPPPAP